MAALWRDADPASALRFPTVDKQRQRQQLGGWRAMGE